MPAVYCQPLWGAGEEKEKRQRGDPLPSIMNCDYYFLTTFRLEVLKLSG